MNRLAKRTLVASAFGFLAGVLINEFKPAPAVGPDPSVQSCPGTAEDFGGNWKAYGEYCRKHPGPEVPKGQVAKGPDLT